MASKARKSNKSTSPAAVEAAAFSGGTDDVVILDTESGDAQSTQPVVEPVDNFRQRFLRGSLDSCGPSEITGWLYDEAQPDVRAELEIRADGIPLARAFADVFRPDLLEGGIGDGNCAFRLPLPQALLDGVEHIVEVVEVSTGYELPGSPRPFRAQVPPLADLRLEHGALRGTARMRESIDSPVLEVLDIESGKVIAAGRGEPEGQDGRQIRIHIPLPADIFDGRPHAFSVRFRDDPVVVFSTAAVMPYMATPESALLDYAREGMTPALSVAAGFRYESLARATQQLSERPDNGSSLPLAEQLAQLSRVHRKLVRGMDPKERHYDPLVFPQHAQPLVSIVVPVHNKFHVTYHCLASLLLAPNDATFELILVDDGSGDATTGIPDLVKGIQYLRNEKPQGFIRSCNRGGQAARGRYIVMLNNDTEVTAGWLDELIWPFDHFEGVGMTGGKLLYPDGNLQEAGGIVWNTGNPWNYGRNANARDPRYNYARQTDYLSGACVMLPLELWHRIGGFSEEYVPAYFEDTDLGFQVRERGFKTVYAPMAQVFHFEGVSNGTSTSSGIKRYQEINRPKFKARWNRAYRNHGEEGRDLELNKDRNVALRALVIDNQIPMPDKDAGSYAAVQEMRLLQALGFKCTFIPQNLAWMAHYTQQLQRMGIETLYAPFYTSINQVLEQRGREFDLVYVTRYYVAQNFIDLIRQHAPQAKIVLMNADLHFLRELRQALQTRNRDDLARSVQTRDEELSVMRKVDLVLSYTDVERAVILSHNLDSTRVERCPWVAEIGAGVPPFAGRQDIAFLGGFGHPPNAEAVEWFVTHVMPLVRKDLPGVKFRVYGSHMPETLANRLAETPDVEVAGWIESVSDCYDHCRVFVAPLQTGAGIKGKVIGALAAGVPTVMSPIAAEGIAVNEGSDGFVASTARQWADAIVKVYGNESLWNKVSQGALDTARRQFGFETGVEQMRHALQSVELFTSDRSETLVARV